MTAHTYRPNPGQPHEWTLPNPQLAGARACRNCGQLNPGIPSGPTSRNEEPSVAHEHKVIAEPYRASPRFDTCSVNLCPFDPEIGTRPADSGDRETKCPLGKRARRVLFSGLPDAAKARLPYGGLFEAEWKRAEARRRLNAALTPEQRERQRAILAAHAFKPRTARAEAPPASEPGESLSGEPTLPKNAQPGGETA